jgi:putative ABC transport system permease protein
MEKYMSTKGEPHPLYHRTLNLIWIRVPDREKFEQSAGTLMNSTSFKTPAIKCETASSGISTFLDAYKDLLRIFHILGYAILLILVLVVANAISIGVRERMTEMAVLKVLGFQPWQILAMVLGEAMLLGMVGGFLSSGFTYWIVNFVMNGIRFPIAFFGAFFVPTDALWWGVVLGGLTSFFGSVIPAWNACAVKVSEIFARVA